MSRNLPDAIRIVNATTVLTEIMSFAAANPEGFASITFYPADSSLQLEFAITIPESSVNAIETVCAGLTIEYGFDWC